jgi:group I intron endonuclease
LAFEVYVIKNTKNDKLYIGVTTKGVDNRFKQHVWQSRKGRKTSALYFAMNKYGSDSFYVERLCSCDTFEEMNDMEVKLIAEMNTLSPNGYNLTSGGDAGTFSEELKLKCSKVRSGEKPHRNTVRAITDKWADPEWREAQRVRISQGMSKSEKAKAAREAQKGVPKTSDHVKALRASRATKVQCVTNGMVFEALVDAVSWLKENGWPKASHSKILRACKSDSYSAYGLKWRKV